MDWPSDQSRKNIAICDLALKSGASFCCSQAALNVFKKIGLCDCLVKVDVILKQAALFWRWRVKLFWVTSAACFNQGLGFNGHWVTWLWSLGSDRLCKCDVRSTTSALNWSSTQSKKKLEEMLILRWSCGIFRQIMLTRFNCWWRFLRILQNSLSSSHPQFLNWVDWRWGAFRISKNPEICALLTY